MAIVLFYSLLATLIATLLLTLLKDEMSAAFYAVIDTITREISSIAGQARR